MLVLMGINPDSQSIFHLLKNIEYILTVDVSSFVL